ncbi:MAG: hypothetical protein M3R63_18610 [Actinomycetota bacterium]|nr:hypothetical protein [Actinomycetota bacterium]
MAAVFAVKVDLADVEAGLRELGRAGKTLSPAFRKLKGPMRLDQRTHAKAEMGPDGKWAPRASSTAADIAGRRRGAREANRLAKGRGETARRKSPGRGKILGRIPSAIVVRSGPGIVEVISRVAYSGVHQEGGKVGRGAVLPARPFLWMSESFIQAAMETFGEHLAKGWVR